MPIRLVAGVILLVYCYILFKVLVFKDVGAIRIGSILLNFGGTQDGPPNFVPFKTIGSYLNGNYGWLIGGLNLLGNIIALMPVGFLAAVTYNHLSWKFFLLLAVIAGLAIECTQALLHVGIFDIDDIILNGIGVLIGFWILIGLRNWSLTLESKKIIWTLLIVSVTAASIITFLGFRKGYLPIKFEQVQPLKDFRM